jgi:molecular chaperone GrpE (heat shock protein)
MHRVTFLCVAQNKLEHEIKERDEKYSELDAKLNRLHKRAKQRIQEVQKVKHCYILFCLVNLLILILSIFP